MNKKRDDFIDSLRGFSIFGMLIVHTLTQFFAILPYDKKDILLKPGIDSFLLNFLSILFVGKFFLIFSLLFGVTFSFKTVTPIQNFNRMFSLFIIGLINFSFYQGDTLINYAIYGTVLIFIINLRPKFIFYFILFFLSGIPKIIKYQYNLLMGLEQIDFNSKIANELTLSSFKIFNNGNYIDVIKLNFSSWNKIFSIFQIGILGRGYQIIGFILLGYLIGKLKLIDQFKNNSKLINKTIKINVVCILLFLSVLAYNYTTTTYNQILNNPIDLIFNLIVYDYFNYSFSFLIILIYLKIKTSNKFHKVFENFQIIGKQSLTAYLSQNIFFTFFYYHWGLNIFSKINLSISIIISIVFYILQIYFAKKWQKKFYYGPVEWIWKVFITRKLVKNKI